MGRNADDIAGDRKTKVDGVDKLAVAGRDRPVPVRDLQREDQIRGDFASGQGPERSGGAVGRCGCSLGDGESVLVDLHHEPGAPAISGCPTAEVNFAFEIVRCPSAPGPASGVELSSGVDFVVEPTAVAPPVWTFARGVSDEPLNLPAVGDDAPNNVAGDRAASRGTHACDFRAAESSADLQICVRLSPFAFQPASCTCRVDTRPRR